MAKKDPRNETMTVKPGMVFKARRDCHIGKLFSKGQIVPFAPGQAAPLWLVELVAEQPPTVEPASGAADTGAGQDEGSGDGAAAGGQGDDAEQDKTGDGFFEA